MYSCLNFVERKACSQSNFGLRKTRSRIREKVNKNKDKKSENFKKKPEQIQASSSHNQDFKTLPMQGLIFAVKWKFV